METATRGACLGAMASRLSKSTRYLSLVGVFVGCGGGIDTVPPPPPPGDGQVTVVALAYGRITRGGTPVSDVPVKVFGSKEECQEPASGTDVGPVGSDTAGWYRKPLQYLGTEGRACLQVRVYFQQNGFPDSLVIRDIFVQVKEQRQGVVPDSVRVDASIP